MHKIAQFCVKIFSGVIPPGTQCVGVTVQCIRVSGQTGPTGIFLATGLGVAARARCSMDLGPQCPRSLKSDFRLKKMCSLPE